MENSDDYKSLKIEEEEVGELISDDGTPSFQTFRFKAFSNKFFSPASIVAVKVNEHDFLVGQITISHEINPNFTAEKITLRHSMNIPSDHPEEGQSLTIFRIYEVKIISQVSANGKNLSIFPPETLPRAGSRIIIPDQNMISQVLGIKNDKENGLYVGNLSTTISIENKIPVILKREILQRHIFIGGTTGSGKSYAVKVLAEEIHKCHLPVIFFDTQDEFTALTRKLDGVVLRPGSDYTIKLSSLTEDEVLNLVPSLHHKLHLEILSSAFIRCRENGGNFGVDDLIKRIKEVCTDQNTAQKTVDTIVQRVSFYINAYNFIGNNFNWIDIFEENNVIHLDCHGFTRNNLQLILASTMRELQECRKDKNIPPYMLFIDEAHLFVPDGENSVCKQIIRENIRMGRHIGICLTLITQSPIDIDKKAIRQCNTRFLFALEPDQLSAIQGVRADATTEMIDKLPKSPVGSCLLSGTYETIKHAIPLAIRELETPDIDSGKAPAIFDEVKKLYKKVNHNIR